MNTIQIKAAELEIMSPVKEFPHRYGLKGQYLNPRKGEQWLLQVPLGFLDSPCSLFYAALIVGLQNVRRVFCNCFSMNKLT